MELFFYILCWMFIPIYVLSAIACISTKKELGTIKIFMFMFAVAYVIWYNVK